MSKTITVIGTGYVGLVTGVCFALQGNAVQCIDIDKAKIEQLRKGILPIYEPGLQRAFQESLDKGNLTFSEQVNEEVDAAEIIFLALPTPPSDDGSANITALEHVVNQLSTVLKSYTVVVNKSTVPVGTSEKLAETFRKNGNTSVDILSNPEFLREGWAVEDFMHPDRIVIGTSSQKAQRVMYDLYSPFLQDSSQFLIMDARSAELTKYAANSFLAMKVSFINEVANLCEKVSANVDNVRLGIGSDPRIGNRFLNPGIGYGGSCFPKDILALLATANQSGYKFRLLESIIDINSKQKLKLVEKLDSYFNNNLSGKHVAIWGLAFKPDTDDIRESPAIYTIQALIEKGAIITAYDPQAGDNMRDYFNNQPNLSFTGSAIEAAKDADALLLVTEWEEFKQLDFKELKTIMKTPAIFDGRNIYSTEVLKSLGFDYYSVGR